MNAIEQLIATRRVIAVLGPGGVGKTSAAAAMGLAAAALGRRALIVTIDPARRLASAMGLEQLAQTEHEVVVPCPALNRDLHVHAMMLDLKAAWDDMVGRLAPSEEQRDRILDNRFYRELSTSLAGSQEYIACEALYTLSHDRDYDLIVLDTPPSTHAIDFLEAPGRILDVFENEALKLVLTPTLSAGRASLRLLDLGGRYVMKRLTSLTGVDMLRSLGEFLLSFSGMYEALRDRTLGFRELFGSASTSFVIVATPAEQALCEMQVLARRLRHDDLALGAVVINRSRQQLSELPSVAQLAADLGAKPDALSLAHKTHAALQHHNRSAQAEADIVAAALDSSQVAAVLKTPRLDSDIHDLNTLIDLATALCPQVFAGQGATS